MTQEKIDGYLAKPLIARVATLKSDGSPHVVPVWYDWDGHALRFGAIPDSQKGKNVRRDPRISVVVDDALDPLRYWGIMLEGRAEIIEDQGRALAIIERICRRYLTEPHLDRYLAHLRSFKHLIVQLAPTRVRCWDRTTNPTLDLSKRHLVSPPVEN